MPATAGALNQLVQILKLAAGGYAPAGDGVWGRLEYERPQAIQVGSMSCWGRGGRLTLRDTPDTRALTTGDRLRFDGTDFAITIRKAKAYMSDDVDVEVQSAPTSDLYAGEMNRTGEIITIRRNVANGQPIEADVRAKVVGWSPEELASGVNEGDRKVLVLAADVPPTFVGGLRVGDRLIVRGDTLRAEVVDDNTQRFAGVLLAYEVVARGL